VNSERRIYRISPRRRAVLWWALGPFAVLGLALLMVGPDEATRGAGAAVAAIMGLGLVGWHWLLGRTALVLTPEGVELRQLGMNLRAPWSEVEALQLVRRREGLIVRTPLAGKGASRLASLSRLSTFGTLLYDDAQRALISERRFIPIEAFAWHAYHGALAKDVARLAPRVRIDDIPP
jgi:hypothetical protein